jgi:hypothetical protein
MRGSKTLFSSVLTLVAVLAVSTTPVRADLSDVSKEPTNSSIGIYGGVSNLSQGLDTHLVIGAHGDYRFSKFFGAGLFFDYVSLSANVPGQPGVAPLVNGSFYVMALEINYFFPGILNALYVGPAFGFSTYNSPALPSQGSYNSVYLAYGAHAGFDIPIGQGFTAGVLVSDIVIGSSSDLGTNTNELDAGAMIKFWF